MNQNIFSRQPPSYRALTMAVITSLVILFVDWRMPKVLEPVREVLRAAYDPIYSIAHYPTISTEWLQQQGKSYDQLVRENKAMQVELLQTQVRLQKLSQLSAENARLRGMLNTPMILDGRIEIAEVIGTDSDPLRHLLIINRGQKDGVYKGQVVLDHQGVMGQIVEVYANSSRMMLLSDKEHSLSVRVERTGMRGIVTGTGDLQRLEMKYVTTNADIEVGDKVYTSGLGVNFPAGYLVGTISKIQRHSTDEFAEIEVQSVANLAAAHHVALLFTNNSNKGRVNAQ
ncbi:rod shape-determining protein MreC [Moraxella sp. ZY210820]|uniref:rod shape-determining protein MreC n=1 Tax=unclassified Moraxella TaxID=2685852 RepID=UPI0027309807|nr:rod shape-determining protein MreC [Moraxella sp. ZY210820]WLF84322.1 rod shape-determining protein MreC [Moraxella sp. ZY210820]